MTTVKSQSIVSHQGQPLELLEALEEIFATHPTFGAHTYILGQLRACLLRRLEAVASRLPAAGELSDALARANEASTDHVTADTVVRCAILSAHGRLEANTGGSLPLEDCEKIFAATAGRLQQGNYDTPLNDGTLRRIGNEPYHGWIWSEQHEPDMFGNAYRRLLENRYQAVPVAPTDEEIARVEVGAATSWQSPPHACAERARTRARDRACSECRGMDWNLVSLAIPTWRLDLSWAVP